MARGLKFRIYKVEGLYYLSSENKGADQLRGITVIHTFYDLTCPAGIDVTPIHIFYTETLIRKIRNIVF